MQKKIKITRDFNSVKNINKIIEDWAASAGFCEDIPYIKSFTDYDNIAYCYKIDDSDSAILLTINILDDEVHLETWAVASIESHFRQKESINHLLERLGQKPI